jgi:hypothetical protein
LQLERATQAGETVSGTELHPIYIFGIDTKTVFDGIVINKRYKYLYLDFLKFKSSNTYTSPYMIEQYLKQICQ